ncbi:MAG: hypothetical protein NC311_10020 [Muribaculaceae bacterium]|nr:hypothetical protein [Muribaculaceae bacterium]
MPFKTYRDAFQALRDFPDTGAPVFFDMDGVLAKYDWGAYLTETRPGVKLYMDESLHYFRSCEPDQTAINLLKAFLDDGRRAYILTSVRQDLPWVRYDKVWWLLKHVPWVDPSTRLIVTSGDKAQAAAARAKTAGLNRNMLLFDDFNPNLDDWRRAGGTPVKYLNGVNTPGTCLCCQFDAR